MFMKKKMSGHASLSFAESPGTSPSFNCIMGLLKNYFLFFFVVSFIVKKVDSSIVCRKLLTAFLKAVTARGANSV